MDAEHDLIRTRIAEDRTLARRGGAYGPPPKFTPQQQVEARRRRAEGGTLKELAKSHNVGLGTISRLSARTVGNAVDDSELLMMSDSELGMMAELMEDWLRRHPAASDAEMAEMGRKIRSLFTGTKPYVGASVWRKVRLLSQIGFNR